MKPKKLIVKAAGKKAKSESMTLLKKEDLFHSPAEKVRHLGNYREFFRYLLANDLDEVKAADELE